MSKERPESKVIRKNCTKITQSIADGGLAQWFASRLAEEDFIASSRHFCTLGVPDFIPVTQMLGAVESKLKITDTPKETLRTFMEILEGSPVLEELARQLNSTYGMCTFLITLNFCMSKLLFIYFFASRVLSEQWWWDRRELIAQYYCKRKAVHVVGSGQLRVGLL